MNRAFNWKEVARWLRRHGWVQVNAQGGHLCFVKDGHRMPTSVHARAQELSISLRHKLRKQLAAVGHTDAELAELFGDERKRARAG